MQRPGGTGSIDRGARVRLIKKVIIGLLAAVILLPTLLCVVLFFKLNKIEQECRDLSERMLVMEKSSDDMYTAVSMERKNAEDAVSFNEIENKESDTPEDVQALPDAAQISKEESVSEDETAHTDWPKKVYLTFDDGPSSNTAAILDILNSYGVKGNFFVVATDKEELRAMYKRIVDEGHVIGMHSYSHKYDEIYASKEAFINDLSKIQSLVYEQTGYMPDIYRFPGGSSNLVSKISMSVFINVLNERGITYYDWNISSQDATNPMLPKEQIVENSLYGIQNYEEAMILMHDLGNKDSTVEALPEIIEKLQAMGAQIAPIDETTMHIQHTNIQ